MNFHQKSGMIHTILGSFCSYLNWEGAEIQLHIKTLQLLLEMGTASFSCNIFGRDLYAIYVK